MSVKYSRLSGGAGESTLFDYSSAFTYASTNPDSYKSAFRYGSSSTNSPDSQLMSRGLEQKPALVKFIHRLTVALIYLVIILTFPISIWFVIKRIKNDEQMVVSRLGMIRCIKGPTIASIIPIVDKTRLFNTSLRAFNIPPQKVMTSDGLLVELGGIFKYHITDAEKACWAAQDIDHTMRVTVQTVAAKHIHASKEKDLVDMMSVQAINSEIRVELQKDLLSWGIAVHSYEITGLKAILRVEEPDALSNVMEPLKQWFFGGHEPDNPAPGSPMSLLAGTPYAQMGNMLAKAVTGNQAATSSNPTVMPMLGQSSFAQAPGGSSSRPTQHGAGVSDMDSLRQKLTPADLLRAVQSISTKELVQQVGYVFKFVVPDASPSTYFMDLKNGNGNSGVGDPPIGDSDTIITMSLADMQRMFTGALQPFDAYMSGALKIDGDTSGAMKLDSLVKSIASMTQGSA